MNYCVNKSDIVIITSDIVITFAQNSYTSCVFFIADRKQEMSNKSI